MSLAPVHRLRKDKIIWLQRNRCRHSHSYLSHYECYLRDFPDENRIGFLDIEVSNLKANMGVIYSYAIKERGSDKVYGRVITKKELFSKDMDKKLVRELVADLDKFDKVVTYYGTGFDLPYIRSRAVYHGILFPEYGQLAHDDLYYIIRNKFKLTRNSLKVACEYLLGETDKTVVEWIHWMRAMQGHKKSLDYIWEHNVYDVLDTEKLWERVINFKQPSNRSI